MSHDALNPGPIPPRLAGEPKHPWYHPYWSPRTKVRLGGEIVTGVILADTIEGWAVAYTNPFRTIGDQGATFRFRGEVQFEPDRD